MNPRRSVGGRREGSHGSLPRRSSTRNYYASPNRRAYAALMCVLALVMIVSAVQLISYAVDYASSRRVSDELRDIYYADETAEATATPTLSAEATATPSAVTTDTPAPENSPEPTAAVRLEAMAYPDNPYTIVSEKFRRLQSQNEDIIGWLSVDRLIDEAVVQRDNSYYLRRDYLGYHNQNGALFLDETISLKTRPYTLMIYGHNMQSGAMFGTLRNYENRAFLLKNPFISFDHMYETGRYVIFAVSTVSTDAQDGNFVNLAKLTSMTISHRSEAIAALQRHSVYTGVIDVQADDQLLLLITCVDDPDERRIVCARRVREDESEESLVRKLNQMWSK